MTRLRNVAVILAGGTGTRIGLNIPKQLIKIAGKPIIEHTIAAMHQSSFVDEIVVMMAPGFLDEVRAIVKHGNYVKVTQILEGAETRNETTAAALAALGAEECNVLLHDAVRPLVSQTIIAANVEALRTHEAVDTVSRRRTPSSRSGTTRTASPTYSPDICYVAVRRLSPSVCRRSGPRTRRLHRTPTSPRLTTAPWCFATFPRSQSRSSPDTNAT